MPARPEPRAGRERVVLWVLALGIFAGLYVLALLRAYTLLGSYDLGYFRQAAWLIAHGEPAFITVRGLYLLGDHASPIFFPMAVVTRVVPTIPALLGIQAAALALGAVPLHAICRRLAGLGAVPAAAVVAAYGLYPALHNLNLSDFHPEVVAVPAMLGAVLFALERRWVPYGACIAVTLLCKEDMAVLVASMGLFLLVERMRRPGLVTLAVGLLWFVIDVRVIQPHYAGSFTQTAFLQRYGNDVGEIARVLLLQPGTVLKDLFVKPNLAFVVAVLAPVLFLPLMRPRYLIPALPLQVLYLLSERASAHTIEAQYVAAIIPFVFVGTAMALGQGGKVVPDRTVVGALVVASFLFNANSSIGGISNSPWHWRTRDRVDQARLAGARLIPAKAAVTATVRVWPLLAERRNLYNFPEPFIGYAGRKDPVRLAARQAGTRYVLVEPHDPSQWDPRRQEALDLLVPSLGFQKIFDRHGVLVFKR